MVKVSTFGPAIVVVMGLLGVAACVGTTPGEGLPAENKGITVNTEDGAIKVAFNPGGAIRWKQSATLALSPSNGWVWGLFPKDINLDRCKYLTVDVKTAEKCDVYFELKDKNGETERPLVGKEEHNNVWKMRLSLPDTKGAYQSITVDLSEHFRPEPERHLAKVIALSDPEGDIEIRGMTFSEKKPAAGHQ